MSLLKSRRARAAAIVMLALALFGATVYAFRAKLPLIGGYFGETTDERRSADASQPSAATAHEGGHAPGAPGAPGGTGAPPGQPGAADARAEVTIDPRRQQLHGVRIVPVERSALSRAIRTVGLVRYDETRLTDINLKLEGWIRELYVDYTGELVRRGQPLFTLYSPELLTTQNEYLLALKTRERVRQSQVPDAREQAKRLVESARRRLTLWDLPPEQIAALEETREPQTALVFRSPANGYVIEKQALRGMHVMPGQSLYKIADLSVVWVEADLYEQELPLVRVGQRAAVTLDAYPGEQFSGRVIYIYPYMEEKTRTARVRFEFINRRGRLKPGMYANAELQVPLGNGVAVPANAVLDSGTQRLVFVSQGEGYFEPRRVKLGQRLGDKIQILDGLKEGEQVATGATFFLDSESQLRAALQGYEATPATEAAAAPSRERLTITFRSEPDPPRSGDNTFEVTVKDPEGKPIADAEVSVAFYMPAMPTMNMPAMRNETKLPPAGSGVYRGPGEVMMAGRWDVTVTVTRGGQRIGTKQLAVVAR